MKRIQVLSDAVKKKIAAGEVVEAPFSVVKELMENALDAGATAVDVEVFESGIKRITVRDNGGGMYRDDLPLAVMEHATSKIVDISDIDGITSFGFRGEAISSISSIARLTILSRTSEERIGGKLTGTEGSVELGDYAGAVGTTVIVENLYYNTPARKKFLKGPAAEYRNIRNVFQKIACASPGVAFSLEADGKRVLTLPPAGDIAGRIGQIYGRAVADGLIHVGISDIRAAVTGFLSGPDTLRATRSMQMLYVNRRPVEYRYLGFLLSRAYETIASRGRHPAALIFIDIEPGLIDVNIHPAKREIRFFDQAYVDSLIINIARKGLGGVHRMDAGVMRSHDGGGGDAAPSGRDAASAEPPGRLFRKDPGRPSFPLQRPGEGADAYRGPSLVGEEIPSYPAPEAAQDARIIGIALGTYILFEKEDALHFLDFHAAHERFIYDRLMESGVRLETQELMFPEVVELPRDDHEALVGDLDTLREIGFDIDDFSDNAVMVRGVPSLSMAINAAEFVADVAECLRSGGRDVKDPRPIVARRLACHSARRANDALSVREMEAIVHEALNGRHEMRCPHGRPFMYRMESADMERLFRR